MVEFENSRSTHKTETKQDKFNKHTTTFQTEWPVNDFLHSQHRHLENRNCNTRL